jgi:hypothetical protein
MLNCEAMLVRPGMCLLRFSNSKLRAHFPACIRVPEINSL